MLRPVPVPRLRIVIAGSGLGFVHNLAVGADGVVAIHGNTGVTSWDAGGTVRWTAAVSSDGEYGVAIEPQGTVAVAVLSRLNGEEIDLARFAADGTPLEGVEGITSQYHGMFMIDASGRLQATSSGHSHVDAFGHSVDLLDPDYVPTGICAAGSDVAWVYHEDDSSFFARDWTANRYHADGTLVWTYRGVVQGDLGLDEFGTIPLDIAGGPDGRIAIVGSFAGPTYFGAWIVTFKL